MGPGCGHGSTATLPSPGSLGSPQEHPSEAFPAPQPLSGYTWCFNKCFLFDFLIFVFSEKALASSNSFLRVAGGKQLVRVSPKNPSQSCHGQWEGEGQGQGCENPAPCGDALGLPD